MDCKFRYLPNQRPGKTDLNRIFNIWIGGGIGMRKNEALERDGGAFVIAERWDGGDQK